MRRVFFITVALAAVLPVVGLAEVTPMLTSTTTATTPIAQSSTTATLPAPAVPVASTPTFADTGETISTPTPNAMTMPSTASFVSLTRQPLSISSMPANTEIVYPEDTRIFDAQNAAEALTHAVGFQFRPQGSPGYPSNAFIRGATANQTLVLIDGRPMEGTALGPADLSEIPSEQIDHIEIVRGGLSSLYGPNALGGVINVITKRATYTGYPLSHVSYEGASFSRQTYKLDFGSRKGPVDFFFFGDQQWESGFRSNSDNQRTNVGGNAGLSLGSRGKILFDAASFHNNAGIPGFRCSDLSDDSCLTSTTPLQPNAFNNKDEKPASTPVARDVIDTTYVRASYLVELPHDMFLAARLYSQEHEVDFDDTGNPNPANATSTDRREHSKGGDVQLNLPLHFLVGGSYTHDQEDLEDRLTPFNTYTAREDNYGLFAQENYQWTFLTLTPSARFDRNSQYGDSTNPRLQAMAAATDWLRFSASAGRSFRAPTFDETRLNPDLGPEKAWTYEAGFETTESSRTFRLNFFRANVGNEIQTSSFTAANLDRARRQGIEIQINHVVSSHFRDGWNYSYLENVGVSAGVDHLVPLAYSPRHTVNYSAVYTPWKKWEFDPVVRYESSRFSGNDQTGDKMGSQLVADLRVAYQWRQMEFFLGIKDIFDKRYVEVPGYPLAGRTAYAGMRLRLWG